MKNSLKTVQSNRDTKRFVMQEQIHSVSYVEIVCQSG